MCSISIPSFMPQAISQFATTPLYIHTSACNFPHIIIHRINSVLSQIHWNLQSKCTTEGTQSPLLSGLVIGSLPPQSPIHTMGMAWHGNLLQGKDFSTSSFKPRANWDKHVKTCFLPWWCMYFHTRNTRWCWLSSQGFTRVVQNSQGMPLF